METLTRDRHSNSPSNASLFSNSVEEQILLSVHLLGKPTAAQLFRLHEREVGTLRRMQGILRRLSSGPDRMLNRIKPFDIAKPILSLPYIYLDTTKSRRFIEERFCVPFRRPPDLPSRDWRFLRHDVTMCDELVAFELTARKRGLQFGYQPLIGADGKNILPKVEIAHDGLTHRLRPQPDKVLLVGKTRIILEHDCGEETVACSNIIRDATIGRKQLVYDALFRSEPAVWRSSVVAYVIESKTGSSKSTARRIRRCLETFPDHVNGKLFLFLDRRSLLAGVNDSSSLLWLRADGAFTKSIF